MGASVGAEHETTVSCLVAGEHLRTMCVHVMDIRVNGQDITTLVQVFLVLTMHDFVSFGAGACDGGSIATAATTARTTAAAIAGVGSMMIVVHVMV